MKKSPSIRYNQAMDEIVALCKRRGFVYPSSEIYGGLANTWDFGHYGVLLKNNIRDSWWNRFVLSRSDMVGIEASTFLNPKVWEASGHLQNFADIMVEDSVNHRRYRADHLIEEYFLKKGQAVKVDGKSAEELQKIITENGLKSPDGNPFLPARKFNQLFRTEIGIIENNKNEVYLRGEIAQGIFLNFKQVVNSMRVRLPFGIAQQGKAYRNEITMGKFLHRTLEFDLMEFEYFIREADWEKTFTYWQNDMMQWAYDLGIDEKKLRWRAHEPFELSHYSKKTMDLEYQYEYGWKEMWGIAYRTDFDLSNHAKHSTKDLAYIDPKTGEKMIPHVIEPTFGLSRLVGIMITDAFRQEEVNGKPRIYLALAPHLAPIKAAVFPLQKDEKLAGIATDIYTNLKQKFTCEYDDAGNIGKMYRRQDEIGTPFCITVDYETENDHAVTVRSRDTMKQARIAIEKLADYIVKGVSL